MRFELFQVLHNFPAHYEVRVCCVDGIFVAR